MAQTKYLDLTGLSYFWSKAKAYIDAADGNKVDKTTTINGHELNSSVTIAAGDINVGGSGDHASKTIQKAIEDLDVAVKAAATAGVQSIDGKTGAITLKAASETNGDINLAISESNELSASIVGLGTAAYTSADDYADAVHNHEISEVNGLDTALAEKATKAVALKDVKATATADASNVTVTFTQTTESGSESSANNFTLPVADETNQGTTTWGKIREIAQAEASIAAGSTYKVKGTKSSIDDVLAVGTAIVGDVWNITAEFTLNGQKFPAGTNVVFIGDGTIEGTGNNPADQAQWDALGGTVDLTPYATTEAMNTALLGKAEKVHTHISSDITDLTSNTVSSIDNYTGALALDKTGGDGVVVFALGEDKTIKGTVDLSGKANASHTHEISEVNGLQNELNAKVNATDLIALETSEIDTIFA